MFPWLLSAAAVAVAVAAFIRTRRLAKRLERLTESYWELKYQHGELRVRMQQLTGDAPAPSTQSSTPPERPREGFVPLASLKR